MREPFVPLAFVVVAIVFLIKTRLSTGSKLIAVALMVDSLAFEFTRFDQTWQRFGAAVVGSICLLYAIWQFGGFGLEKMHEKIWFVFVIYSLFGVAVGFLYGNNIVYNIGDFYKILVFSSLYLAAVRMLKVRDVERLLFYLCIVLMLVSIHMLTLRVYAYMIGGIVPKVGGSSLLPFSTFLMALSQKGQFCYVGNNKRQRLVIWVLFLVSAALIVLLSSRRAMVGAGAIVLFCASYIRNVKVRLKIAGLVVVSVAFIGVTYGMTRTPSEAFFSALVRSSYDSILGTYSNDTEELEPSSYQRIYQVKEALQLLISYPFAAVFGFGSGAQYFSEVAALGGAGHNLYYEANFYIHDIHNTYVAVLYRYGALGGALFLAFWVSYFRFLRRELRKGEDWPRNRLVLRIVMVFFLYVVTIECNTIYSFFYPFYFAFLLSIPRVLGEKDKGELIRGSYADVTH